MARAPTGHGRAAIRTVVLSYRNQCRALASAPRRPHPLAPVDRGDDICLRPGGNRWPRRARWGGRGSKAGAGAARATVSHLPAAPDRGRLLAARDRRAARHQREKRQRLRQPRARAVSPGASAYRGRCRCTGQCEWDGRNGPMKTPISAPCAEWAPLLAASHPDNLLPDQEAALEAHVASCPACTAARADYLAMDGLIRRLPVPTPLPGLPPALLRHWRREDEPQATSTGSPILEDDATPAS